MQMSPKTVNYGGKKSRFRRRMVFAKNLGFGVGFGYLNNTNQLPRAFKSPLSVGRRGG